MLIDEDDGIRRERGRFGPDEWRTDDERVRDVLENKVQTVEELDLERDSVLDLSYQTFLWISAWIILSGIGDMLRPIFPNTPVSWVGLFLLLAVVNVAFESGDRRRNSDRPEDWWPEDPFA